VKREVIESQRDSNEVVASLNQVRISPKRIQPLISLLKGKKRGYQPIDKCLKILLEVDQKGALFLTKLINSAVANAIHRGISPSVELLRIKKIDLGHGRNLKRILIGSKGRSSRKVRRFSNLRIVLIKDKF